MGCGHAFTSSQSILHVVDDTKSFACVVACETNTPTALFAEHPKPAPRTTTTTTAPVPKPRHTTQKDEIKPPEIVGVVLKTPSEKTVAKERDMQIWSSLLSLDDELLSLYSSDGEVFSKKPPSEDCISNNSSLIYHDDEKKALQEEAKVSGFKENRSVTSLKSVDSVPAFLGAGSMKKWTNFEDLDELTDDAETVSKWEVGDTTDTGMFQLLLTLLLLYLYVYLQKKKLYIHSVVLMLQKDHCVYLHLICIYNFQFFSESLSTAPNVQSPRESVASLQPPSYTPSPPCSELSSYTAENKDPVQTNNEINLMLQSKSEEDDGFHDAHHKELKTDDEVDDVDWQYQLPSPPTAFRDASPAHLTEETSSLANAADSVVTSPELFEKLDQVKSTQSETETTTTSDTTSTISEEENKKICNKLSLENLEKRKSLVYNRELSTSLKLTEESLAAKHSEVLNELEGVIQMPKQSSELSRRNSQVNDVKKPTESVLPNFVITTYDNPKKKIKVFEDDSVRSNEQNRRAESEPRDTVSYRKQSDDGVFKKPFDVSKRNSLYSKPQNDSNYVARSGSFSTESNLWKPLNPVKRSKSQLTVARNSGESAENDGMSRSNSLFDVSGLHSLEVGCLHRIKPAQTRLGFARKNILK